MTEASKDNKCLSKTDGIVSRHIFPKRNLERAKRKANYKMAKIATKNPHVWYSYQTNAELLDPIV